MKALLVAVLIPLGIPTLHGDEAIPVGYVKQVMEPTGGMILKPKDWFYNEGHRKGTFMWTISKEDTHGGKENYDTGVRIQLLTGVAEATGKSPERFIKGFLERKNASAEIVHKACDKTDQGSFSRVCLEITSGDHRVLYSFFWNNALDIAVVSIAGAKKEQWDKYTDIFNKMSSFELLDVVRFKDPPKKGEPGGAGQPATAPESQPEDKGNPQPESKLASR